MVAEWQTGKVVRIVEANHNTRRYFIRTDNPLPFDFKPGQFVTLDLPIHEKKNKRWRSYSIASAPNGTNEFELLIVLLETGLGTPYLFHEFHEGDSLTFRGPLGAFCLPEKIEHDYFFICTGTGIAPFRSMLQTIQQNNLQTKNIFLVFGTRTQSTILYNDEMKNLEKQLPHFTFIPVLSREQWNGKQGYVHEVYTELAVHYPQAHFMLCGWRNMVDDAKVHLAEMGIDKDQIKYELYG